jgi:hypothetical protein
VPTSFLPWWDNAAQRQVFDLIRGLIEILVPFNSCLQTVCARSSFEPLRGEARAGGSSNESQPVHTGGRHFVSYPARTSERYGLTTTSAYILKQALWGYVVGASGATFGGSLNGTRGVTIRSSLALFRWPSPIGPL